MQTNGTITETRPSAHYSLLGSFQHTQQQASSLKVDLALAGPETQGATSNLNVILQPSQGSTLAALAPQLREGLVLGGPLHAGLVVCQRDGKVYLVNFAAHPQAFTTDRAALDELLASWSWD